jgi:uncharacterized membrane protein
MELIPILSLIILVATISTFILSIGAYILYKMREKKGKAVEQPKPEAIPAELVTPQVAPEAGRTTNIGLRSTYGQSLYSTRGDSTSPMFATDAGQTRPEMRPTVLGLSMDEESRMPVSGAAPGRTTINAEKYETRGRFSRYTSAGYSNVEETKKKKEDEEPLRWR